MEQHWHGLTEEAAPFSDGTPSASQWPIPPGHFFDYELAIPEGKAGSYFYHSHVGFQSVSASGPLIIEDRLKPYHYDEERIVYLQDVFQETDDVIEQGLTARYNWTWSGESAMILVNGQGGGSASGTQCKASLSTINVEPGKTYRLRFIGATALTFATLEIEGHALSVIQADRYEYSGGKSSTFANRLQFIHSRARNPFSSDCQRATLRCSRQDSCQASEITILDSS